MIERTTIFEETTGFKSIFEMFANLFNIKAIVAAGLFTTIAGLLKTLFFDVIIDQGVFIAILIGVTLLNWIMALALAIDKKQYSNIKIARSALKLVLEMCLILAAAAVFGAIDQNIGAPWITQVTGLGPLFVSLTFILQHLYNIVKNAHGLGLIDDQQKEKLNGLFDIVGKIKSIRKK